MKPLPTIAAIGLSPRIKSKREYIQLGVQDVGGKAKPAVFLSFESCDVRATARCTQAELWPKIAAAEKRAATFGRLLTLGPPEIRGPAIPASQTFHLFGDRVLLDLIADCCSGFWRVGWLLESSARSVSPHCRHLGSCFHSTTA